MAHIVPSDVSRLALSGGSRHELDTLQQLKIDLPNDYTVFHGVHWSREYEAWTHFGEIDFVVCELFKISFFGKSIVGAVSNIPAYRLGNCPLKCFAHIASAKAARSRIEAPAR